MRDTAHVSSLLTNHIAEQIACTTGMPQSRFRKSRGTCDATHEEHDGSGVEEGACRVDCSLEILSQSAIASDPREETFDHPATRVDSKADLIGILAHDLDGDQRGRGDPLTCISAVGKDPLYEWEDAA